MAQLGRALPWGGRGRGFKSRRSDQLSIFKASGVIRVLSNSSIFYCPIFSISIKKRIHSEVSLHEWMRFFQTFTCDAKDVPRVFRKSSYQPNAQQSAPYLPYMETSKASAFCTMLHLFPCSKMVGTSTSADILTVAPHIVVAILLKIIAHGDIARVDIEPSARQRAYDIMTYSIIQ